MEDTRQIAQLIKKHLEGTLTPPEQAQLMRWVAGAPENNAYFERIENGDAVLEDLKELHRLIGDEQTPWPEALAARLRSALAHASSAAPAQQLTPPPEESPVHKRRRWLPYAAAILVTLSIGIGLYWYSQQGAPAPQLTSQYGGDALPGGNRATLTLADGRTIDLSEAHTGIVVGEEVVYNDGSEVLANGKERLSAEVSSLMAVSTPKGGTYQITLPDGTKVWLNAQSMLKYPSRFSGAERIVELTGEAYFDVAHAEEQKDKNAEKQAQPGARVSRVPFLVKTSNQTVEVLGTRFNISAYPDEPETQTTLVQGAVRLWASATGASVSLVPGEQGRLSNGVIETKQVDVTQFTAWKDGYFVFDGTELRNVLRQLSRWYDVEVDYTDLPSRKLNARVSRNKNISSVLGAISKTTGLDFSLEERRLHLKE